MDAVAFLKALRHRWWVVLLAALLGAGAGIGASAMETHYYASSADVYLAQVGTDAGVPGRAAVANFAHVATQPDTLREVMTTLKLQSSEQSLASEVQVDIPAETSIITITATDKSPAQAAAIANELATVLVGRVSALSAKDQQGHSTLSATVSSRAVAPSAPVEPGTSTTVVLSTGIGLVAGVAVVLLWEAVAAYSTAVAGRAAPTKA